MYRCLWIFSYFVFHKLCVCMCVCLFQNVSVCMYMSIDIIETLFFISVFLVIFCITVWLWLAKCAECVCASFIHDIIKFKHHYSSSHVKLSLRWLIHSPYMAYYYALQENMSTEDPENVFLKLKIMFQNYLMHFAFW